jgi:hypothetical protein
VDRILRSAAGTVQIQLYDSTGAVADPGGTVTAAVKDSAGVAIAGSPFTASGTGTNPRTFSVTLAILDTYDVTWTLPDTSTRRTQFEVVGGFVFAVAELRAFDSLLSAKTAPELREIREIVEEKFEVGGNVSFTLRGHRVAVDGKGTDKVFVPDVEVRTLVAASIDSVALSAPEIAAVKVYPFGMLVRPSSVWSLGWRNVSVLYEHGLADVPSAISRAAKKYARYLMLNSAAEASERATAMFTEAGGYRLTLAGRDGPTGLPEVDAVLAEFGHASVGFA